MASTLATPTDTLALTPTTDLPSVMAGDSSKIICQFCQERGQVTVRTERRAKRKTATRMLFGAATLGGSLAATGVSKKGTVTVLRCGNCGMSWDAPLGKP